MPYPGVPENKWPKMERCVSKIKGNYTKSQKVAICHSRVMGEEAIAEMTDGGVPEFEARARWAAAFWREHGLFPHQIFEGEDFGYDIPTAGLLATETKNDADETNTTNYKVESMMQGSDIRFQEMTLPLAGFKIGDDNTLTIMASKDGAKAYLHTGTAVTWKEGVLGKIADTWKGGRVGANHEHDVNEGNILLSRYEKPFLIQTVRMSDELKGHIERNKGFVGVSIEATEVELDEKEQHILGAKGTGVTFVFYPKKPACNKDDGCGIVGADPETGKLIVCPAYGTDECRIKESDTQGEEMDEDEKAKNAQAEAASEIESLKEQLTEVSTERDSLKEFKLEILNARKAKLAEEIRKMTATDEEDGLDAMEVEQLEALHKSLLAAKEKAEAEETEDSGAVGTEPTQEEEAEAKKKAELKEELDTMQAIELAATGANVHGKVIDLTGELPVEEPKKDDEEKKKKEGES